MVYTTFTVVIIQKVTYIAVIYYFCKFTCMFFSFVLQKIFLTEWKFGIWIYYKKWNNTYMNKDFLNGLICDSLIINRNDSVHDSLE